MSQKGEKWGGIDTAADPAGIGSERRNKSARPVVDENYARVVCLAWPQSAGVSDLRPIYSR
jgi:hypothetical protein